MRIRDVIQNRGTLGRGALAPLILSRVRRVERQLDVLRTGMRDLAERLARRRRQILSILPGGRGNPMSADEVLVALLELYQAAGFARRLING